MILEQILQSRKTNDSSCKCMNYCRLEEIELEPMSEAGQQLFQPVFQFHCLAQMNFNHIQSMYIISFASQIGSCFRDSLFFFFFPEKEIKCMLNIRI